MKIMNKKPAILYLLVVSMFCSVSLRAQEQDPFFPSGPRSSETGSVPPGPGWGRDPFTRPFEGKNTLLQPVSGLADRIRGFRLTGIIYGKGDRIAIIGGEAYREGSMVGDRRLVDVKKRSVVLMNAGGSREELFIEDFSIRK
jgi:hypothetical protein